MKAAIQSAEEKQAARWPIALALLAVGLPLLLSPFDFWDGRLLFHALETGQHVGVQEWFTTSGWLLQLYLFNAIQALSGLDAPLGLFLMRLVMLLSVCGLVYETMRLAQGVLRLPASWAMLAGVGVAVFPAWNVLLSSVTFMYVLCAWLCLLALRLAHEPSALRRLAGFLLLLVSFQLNSNFVFAIALSAVYLISRSLYAQLHDRRSWLPSVAVMLLSVASFVALKLLFTPSGMYENYNALQPLSLVPFVVDMLRYFQYAIVLTGVVLGMHAGLMLLKGRWRFGGFPKAEARALLWPLLAAVFLIGSAAFPYVMVGKPADIRAVMVDWNARNTFLMAMPVALFLVSLARLLCGWHGTRSWLPAAAALLLLLAYQQASFWHKLSRAAYEAGMIQALSELAAPQPGFVTLVAQQMPIARIRFYESNWLLYKAYAQQDWVSAVVRSPDAEPQKPDWIEDASVLTQASRVNYMMADYRPQCDTRIRITGAPYHALDVLKWAVLARPLPGQLRASLIDASCVS